VRELGQQITRDYRDRDAHLVMVGVLKGAFVFLADLVRWVELPVVVDFMAVASYGASTRTSGVVRILKDLDEEITGRDVLLVEDIVDTGLTLDYLLSVLGARRPRSLKVCCLLDKPARRLRPVPVHYRGFEIPDVFVVGYGLDCGERYRNLNYIAVLHQEDAGRD